MLVSLVCFTILVVLLLAVLVALTVVPVFLALQMADARRFSTGRWAALSAGAVVVGLGLAYVLHQHDLPRLVVLAALVLSWAGPAGLWLLAADDSRLGGRAGLHE
jgi:hypothetical protein